MRGWLLPAVKTGGGRSEAEGMVSEARSRGRTGNGRDPSLPRSQQSPEENHGSFHAVRNFRDSLWGLAVSGEIWVTAVSLSSSRPYIVGVFIVYFIVYII